MSTLNTVRSQALQLSPIEREELAQELIESLPVTNAEDSATVESEYEEEIQRRLQSIQDGTAKTTSGDQFLAELQSWRQRAEKS